MPECISGKMSFLNLAALTVVHLKNQNPNVKQGSAGSVMGNLASSVVSWLIGNVLPPLNNSISTLMRSDTLQDHTLQLQLHRGIAAFTNSRGKIGTSTYEVFYWRQANLNQT